MNVSARIERQREEHREQIRQLCAINGIHIGQRGKALELLSPRINLMVVDLCLVNPEDLKVSASQVWRPRIAETGSGRA